MITKDIATGVGAVVVAIGAVAGTVFVLPLILPLFGALAGLIVGYVFDGTSRAFLDALGMQALSMWQFGAMAAFAGSFFRSKTFR